MKKEPHYFWCVPRQCDNEIFRDFMSCLSLFEEQLFLFTHHGQTLTGSRPDRARVTESVVNVDLL